MQSKSLLIAIAAFAVTTTGAQAYGGAILNRANLTEDQRSALEEARELRQSGKADEARDLLVEAGIDETALQELKHAARQTKEEVRTAIEDGDYERFRELVADTPLAELVTTPADFERLLEAHKFRQTGDFAEARNIFDELGLERPHWRADSHHRHGIQHLRDAQWDALRVARQANDRQTVRAILDEAGLARW